MGKKNRMIVLFIFCMAVFGAGCFALGMAAGGKGNKNTALSETNRSGADQFGNSQPESNRFAENNTGMSYFGQFSENLAESVVMLEIYDKSDVKIATASGFAAFEPKRLVTCLHALVNMDYAVCTTEYGKTFRVESIVAADETSDIAFIALPDDCGLKSLPLSEKTLQRGEGVTAVGSQFGILNVVTCGNVSMIKPSYILFTAPVNSGSSGGPLIDWNGTVCGVVRGAYGDGAGINVAVPIDSVIKLYNKNGGVL